MLSAPQQSTVAASFENPTDSQLAVWDLLSTGFPQNHIYLRGKRRPILIVEAGDRYDEAEHVLRRYNLRLLRIWMRSGHPRQLAATVGPSHIAAGTQRGRPQPA